jgi:proline iminopeptidase
MLRAMAPSSESDSQVRVGVTGGEIVGSRRGTGEPALLLHGGPGLGDYMGPVADELAPLFDVVQYQQRGLPPSVEAGPHDIETNVADAIAVLDALGFERAWLIGHSAGGLLAMHVAVAVPERVLGLITINTRGAVPDGGIAAMIVELRKRYEALYGRPSPGMKIAEGWPLRFSDPWHAPAFPGIAQRDEVLSEVHKSVDQHYERQTLVRGLAQLRVPALFIHGRQDPLPPSVSEETAALIPGAEVQIIENCGHFPWIEYPGIVGRLVAEHVSALRGEAQSR